MASAPSSSKSTSWLKRLSRLSVIAAGATAGIGIALWLLPEEEDGDEDFGFFVKDASFPFGRSSADFDDDEDSSVFHRGRRRHQRPTFASKTLHPPSPPSFLAQLTDTLERAGENAARGGRAARTLAKAAARDGLLFPPLPLSKGGAGGFSRRSDEHSSPPLLSAVASWTRDPKTRRALADAGGTSLGAWLLDAAAADDAAEKGSSRESAEGALVRLLLDPATAPAVLRAPAAPARILALIASSSDPSGSSSSSASLAVAAANAAASESELAAAEAWWACGGGSRSRSGSGGSSDEGSDGEGNDDGEKKWRRLARHRRWRRQERARRKASTPEGDIPSSSLPPLPRPLTPRLDDIRAASKFASSPSPPSPSPSSSSPSSASSSSSSALAARALAVSFLASWAEASPTSAGKVVAGGGAAALGAAAAAAAAGAAAAPEKEGGGQQLISPAANKEAEEANRLLARAAVRGMRALASPEQPLRQRLAGDAATSKWVDSLAYLLADAAAQGDDEGAARVLDALAAALSAGVPLVAVGGGGGGEGAAAAPTAGAATTAGKKRKRGDKGSSAAASPSSSTGAGAPATAGALGPLLARLAASSPSTNKSNNSTSNSSKNAKPPTTTSPLVRRAACRALAAAAASPTARGALGEDLLDDVADALIARLVEGGSSGTSASSTSASPEEAAAAVRALSALSMVVVDGEGNFETTPRGASRAAVWLGELLVAASRDATPFGEVGRGAAAAAARKAAAAAKDSAAAAAAASSSSPATPPAADGSSEWFWQRYYRKKREDAAAAAAASPEKQQAPPQQGWRSWWRPGAAAAATPPTAETPPTATARPWWDPRRGGGGWGGAAATTLPPPLLSASADPDDEAGSVVPAEAAEAAERSEEEAEAEEVEEEQASAAIEKGAEKEREKEEDAYSSAVALLPRSARGAADALREAFGRAATYQEPPPDAETLLPPAALRAYAAAAAAVDGAVAESALGSCLHALAELSAAPDAPEKVSWLASRGLVELLEKLVLDRDPVVVVSASATDAGEEEEEEEEKGDDDGEEEEDNDSSSSSSPPALEPPSLVVRRAAARLLAMAAATPEGHRAIVRRRSGGGEAARSKPRPSLSSSPSPSTSSSSSVSLSWLRAALRAKDDLPLASHAARALLSLERRGEPPSPGTVELKDGVHLFVPGARHHALLSSKKGEGGKEQQEEGGGEEEQEEEGPELLPLVDVVFVHGLRGGPFATWRVADRAPRRGAAAPRGLPPADVWPAAWLSEDVLSEYSSPRIPRARLLSVDYAAPASGWEGESMPLAGTVARLARRLEAARVGRDGRRVVFVCHSLGGVLAKELIATSLLMNSSSSLSSSSKSSSIGEQTRGVVFYACPHRGSWLAGIGWNLRFLGAAPAAPVSHLRYGPHLMQPDAALKARHALGKLRVLSFGETERLAVAPLLPRVLVVPPESASPGYGEFVLLEGEDHIGVCKPGAREDVGYERCRLVVEAVIREAEREEREEKKEKRRREEEKEEAS